MNPVLFQIGGLNIRWYSVFILVGIIISVIYLKIESSKFNITWDFIFNLIFWTIIIGFIGARLYYVLFNLDTYVTEPLSIFKVWEGGLAIHGGLIFGLLTMYFYCKKYNARLLRMTDLACIPLILSQAIGRWGNFFNSEAYGSVTSLSFLNKLHIPKFIIDGMYIEGEYHLPMFYFESIWCILGFIILMIVKRYKYLKVGQLTCIYMMWYSVGRFVIEIFREDALTIGGLKIAQVVSVLLFIIGMLIFMVLSRKSKFEDLYSDTNSDDIRY